MQSFSRERKSFARESKTFEKYFFLPPRIFPTTMSFKGLRNYEIMKLIIIKKKYNSLALGMSIHYYNQYYKRFPFENF